MSTSSRRDEDDRSRRKRSQEDDINEVEPKRSRPWLVPVIIAGAAAILFGVSAIVVLLTPPPKVQSDVGLRFVKAGMREAGFAGPAAIVVTLEARNANPTRRYNWKPSPYAVELVDEHGNKYKLIGDRDEFLDPGVTSTHRLSFDRPTPQAKKFKLTVGGEVAEMPQGWTFQFDRPAD